MKRISSFILMCLLQILTVAASPFTLKVEVVPAGAATPNTQGGTYEEGEVLSLRLSTHTGFIFKGWYVNEDVVSSTVNFKYTMPSQDVVLKAIFEYDPDVPANPAMPDTMTYFSLTAAPSPLEAATLNLYEGKYPVGASVNMRSNGRTGYVFDGWQNERGETLSSSASFNFNMPAQDTHLTAIYHYDPTCPSDPEQTKRKYPLTVEASPSGAGRFSWPSDKVASGEEYNIYAYPSSGYRFNGWIVNGVAQEETSTTYRGVMTEAGAQVVGLFEFDPTPPANPDANHYNPTTGQTIIDDFRPGYLYDALQYRVGWDNFSNVSSLIVKGRMNSGDFGILSYLNNAATIDLSRVGGITSVPGYAFSELTAASILLPSTIGEIGNYAFQNCKNLTSVTIYSLVPPSCTSYTFGNFPNKDNCSVYVPREAMELYANADYWKDFTILPIMTDAHVLQVTLPEEAADGRYKHNSIEIVNLSSGVRQKYVISDRLVYTFNGLQKDEQYNVYMLSQSDLEIGRIENVVIPNDDIEVTFEELKTLHTATAKVLALDGTDVTSQVSVEWLKPLEDRTVSYLRKATSISEMPEGEQLLCRIGLDSNLGTVYVNPEDVEFTVTGNDNTCIFNLVPFRTISISGTVVDGDGSALSGASVSANQMLNGKFSKTYTAKTDRKGEWTISVLDAPTTNLTFAASECVNVNDTIGVFDAGVASFDCGKTTMKSIVGARVNYGFTYHAVGEEEVESYYPDYQNVAISVYNETQDRPHNDVSLQYPLLAVLDENINAGDKLKLTATSKTGAFNPIVETVTIGDNQRAEMTFDIVGKGGIQASFEMTENPAVTAMLYSDKGELVKKQSYSEAKTTFTGLEDGSYTLVSMGQSDLMNSILRLTNFAEIGLFEGKDYVMNSVKVESGKLAEITNSEIPAFDESIFYYTNSSTGFSANKSSITTGNYLTLRAAIDFKGVYKDDISNVALIVDLPEACDFVEQSVIQGPNLLPYTIDNNRLTIQLGNDYQNQTRFCVVPTLGGSFNASASVAFEYKGKILIQSIGYVSANIKDLDIYIPNIIAKKVFTARGVAPSKSHVTVYANNDILGECYSNANGTWSLECELQNPKRYESYKIFAKIGVEGKSVLESACKTLYYNDESTIVNKITMVNQAHNSGSLNLCEYITNFDFQGTCSPETYWYWPSYPTFTFMTDLTPGRYDTITNVKLYVLTEKNKWETHNSIYDEKSACWITTADFISGNLPINVGVGYSVLKKGIGIDEVIYNFESKFEVGDYNTTDNIHCEGIEDENKNEISFYYSDDDFSGLRFKKLTVGDSGKLTLEYNENGVNNIMEFSIYGLDVLPEDVQTFRINGYYEIYEMFNIKDNVKNLKLIYPVSFIDSVLESSSNKCFEFMYTLREYAKDSKYVVSDLNLSTAPSKKVIFRSMADRAYYDAVLDRLDRLPDSFECEAVQPIIEKVRRKAENARQRDAEFDLFRAPFELLSRIFKPTGSVGKAAMAGVDTATKSVEVGQDIGNYSNNLEFSNDFASMEDVGCKPEEETPNDIPPITNPNDNANYVMDPSGYVYEAIPTNRVEGVQATIYYKETKEDMYGDPYEEIVLWDAEEYAQKNPLFTDENGMYQWDVPQGLWQVKFEKDGYATAYSAWLPVPPPQLEVNIGIVQNKQPEVTEARAYEDGIEVQFDKFMDLSTLNISNIYVTANGEKLNGEISLVDSALADEYASEDDTNATRYASRVRFVPEEKLSTTTGEIRLTVSRNVLSYAGIPMTETFSQVLDVEKEVKAIVADDVKVLYGGEKEVTISAIPFDAAVNRKLHIALSSDLIASIDKTEAVFDEEGKATIIVKGDLPGRCQLTFSIDDVTETGDCTVDVVTEIITAEAPKSSRASGTAVYRGTKIELTTESKDATIYFTTDGSCPCDENGTRRKYTVPIVINEDTKILAMTSVGNGDDDISEIVEFNYTLKRTDMDFQMEEGWTWISHCFDNSISPAALAEEGDIRRVIGSAGEAIFDFQEGFTGTLTGLAAAESYRVETVLATSRKRISNIAWNPTNPIAISKGWNWLGYPVEQTMAVNEALASTDADTLDVIVGQDGFAQYDGEKWIGTLETMQPGKGYMYLSKTDKKVTYNTAIVSTAAAKSIPGIFGKTPLVVDIHKYCMVMPVVANVCSLDGTPLDNSNYQLAAFCGSECRGVGKVIDGRVMMNVYGETGDHISFKVTDTEGVDFNHDDEALTFSETVIGDLFNPYSIMVKDTDGVETIEADSPVKVMFEGDMLLIKGVPADDVRYVEVYDIQGQKLIHETRVPESGIKVQSLTDGIYVVIVNANGDYSYHKIVK